LDAVGSETLDPYSEMPVDERVLELMEHSLTDVGGDVAHGRAVGDEGDDPHRAATVGAHPRENFVDTGE